VADTPIIGYNNLLTGSNYTLVSGTDDSAAPLSDAWSWDMSRPALPRADASGVLSFTVPVSSGVGYGYDASGNYVAYGDLIGYGGVAVADIIILGAARNNPSGERFQGGSIQVIADNVVVFSRTIYEPRNASVIYNMTPHAAPSAYTITLSGLTPDATVRIPELFIGPALNMPRLDYGIDFYPETFHSTSFPAVSGRVIRSRKFVRAEDNLSWSNIEPEMANQIKVFVETALETVRPFWFCAFPESKPTDCYMGMHIGDRVRMPIGAVMRIDNFKLKFQESL